MLCTRALLATVGAGCLGLGSPPAQADDQASAIVERMLAQKADVVRQAETYIVSEQHDMGTTQYSRPTIQPVMLYSSVCNPDRYNFAVPADGDDYNTRRPLRLRCQGQPDSLGHSLVRPKEVEYMLLEDQYAIERETAMKMFPLMLSALSGAAGALSLGDVQDSLGIPVVSGVLSPLRDHFSLTDLRRDIDNAIQERKDLLEFGRVANVLGEITVDGRPAWALVARDLNRKQVTEEGTFTITGVGLVVDKTRHVQLAMFVEGTSEQGNKGKPQRFWISRQDRDYRPIEGTTALIPFKTTMALSLKLEDEKSQREMREAKAELDKARAQLKEMRSQIARAQKSMDAAQSGLAALGLGGMLGNQMEALEKKVEMFEGMGLANATDARNSALRNLEIKTLTAAQMQEVLNGEGAGDTRTLAYARKGGLLEYLAALHGRQADREGLEREFEQWQARKRASETADQVAASARERARQEELDELRKEQSQ